MKEEKGHEWWLKYPTGSVFTVKPDEDEDDEEKEKNVVVVKMNMHKKMRQRILKKRRSKY